MNLKKKKRLAARTLHVGIDRIIFVPGKIDELKENVKKSVIDQKKHEADQATEKEVLEKIVEKTKATIRGIPFDGKKEKGKCILCGKESEQRVVFAKAY